MNNKIQNFLIRFTGLSFLFREVIQRRKVTIVFLHNWSTETAKIAFKYFSKNYNIISLNDFIEYHYQGKTKSLPSKSLIITIDDGYKENYDLLPLIKKYKIPVTIFLTAGIVDSNKCFWFDIKKLPYTKEYLKSIPNKQRLNLLREADFKQEKEFNEPVALNKNQILEMKEFVNFQGHTMFHPILPKCSDNEAKYEILESKELLEREFGLKINTIAFPNGDFSERDIELVKEAGYKCSLTTEPGFNDQNTNIFRLKRISLCYKDLSKTDLSVITTGIRIYAFNFKALFSKKLKNNFKSNF